MGNSKIQYAYIYFLFLTKYTVSDNVTSILENVLVNGAEKYFKTNVVLLQSFMFESALLVMLSIERTSTISTFHFKRHE